MKKYIFESVYILKGSLTEKEAKEEIKKLNNCFKGAKTFKSNTLKNYKQGFIGLKPLAYEIKGNKQGYYFIKRFEGTYRRIYNLEKTLRLNENVIKFMTIKIEN